MISKDKVNSILTKFQAILKEEKPSLQELLAIQMKINRMVQDNVRKQRKSEIKDEEEISKENWFNVDIE